MAAEEVVALIDGDLVVHRWAVVLDDPIAEKGPGLYQFNFKDAFLNVRTQLDRISEAVGATRVVVCLTSKTNYRKEVNPTYKGNRTGSRKAIMLKQLRAAMVDHLAFTPGCASLEQEGLEADDLIGILATRPLKPGRDSTRIVCSIDKDLRTIPGLHWNWDKQDHFLDDPEEISEEEADALFYIQALAGDPTDGYAGCAGIGPVKALKLLDGVASEDKWAVIVEAYEKAGHPPEDALVNARCARILRASDFNFKTKEPILWSPPASS